MFAHTAKQIYEKILVANSLVLVPHQGPDGDALGASTAFAQWLNILQKPYTLFCKTPSAPKFSYLPNIERLTTDTDIWKNPIDVVVVFDSGDLEYAGVQAYIEPIRSKILLINIDHHATNTHFGDLNLVDTASSSTSEMIQRFFFLNHIAVEKNMATSLTTGFITDTDSFTNAATTRSSLASVGQLLEKGAKLFPIQERVYKDISIPALKIWGIMLEHLEKDNATDTVYSMITQQDLRTVGISEKDLEGFFTLMNNFLNNISDGKAKFLLKEGEKNQWKGSFRTTRNDVDVSAYAQLLGGGGHQKAAGFRVNGEQNEAVEKVLSAISQIDQTKETS